MEIKQLTKNADKDNLTDQDYRDIFNELRDNISLDKFVDLIKSSFSKALWSKYHNGQITLNRQMRNELRVAVGGEPLPPTIEEATSKVDPNAEVTQIGADQPDKVILVGTKENLSLNVSIDGVKIAVVTKVTSDRKRKAYTSRPVVTETQKKRVNELGVSWREVIDAGIEYINGQQEFKKVQEREINKQ